MIKVILPNQLEKLTDGILSLDAQEGDLNSVLLQLCSQFTKLKKIIYTQDGNLSDFVGIALNDQLVENDQIAAVNTKAGDIVELLMPIAGG